MNYPKRIMQFALVFAMSLFLTTACSDSSGTDEEPPVVPDLEAIQPDFDYFDQNAKQLMDPTNYNNGAVYAGLMEGLFTIYSSFSLIYLELAEDTEADLEGDTWVWSYEYSAGPESVAFELRATPQGDEVNWELLFSASLQDGTSFNDVKYMEGTIANDGLSGSWSILPFLEEGSSSGPVVTYSWDYESQENGESVITFYDGANAFATITYTKDGADNTVVFDDDGDVITLYWNTDTNTGYYIDNGMQYCWDASLQSVACS